jgi:hypothetical protein
MSFKKILIFKMINQKIPQNIAKFNKFSSTLENLNFRVIFKNVRLDLVENNRRNEKLVLSIKFLIKRKRTEYK